MNRTLWKSLLACRNTHAALNTSNNTCIYTINIVALIHPLNHCTSMYVCMYVSHALECNNVCICGKVLKGGISSHKQAKFERARDYIRRRSRQSTVERCKRNSDGTPAAVYNNSNMYTDFPRYKS